jgi:hypothetical protein
MKDGWRDVHNELPAGEWRVLIAYGTSNPLHYEVGWCDLGRERKWFDNRRNLLSDVRYWQEIPGLRE